MVLPLGPFVEKFYMQTRNNHSNAMVLGRLKPGVTLASATSEMESIAAHLGELYPKSNSFVGVRLISLHEYLMNDAKPRQLLLMGAVGLVLLIVCVNIATLSLARSCARDREMSIRAALGAARNRLVRQLLVESFCWPRLAGHWAWHWQPVSAPHLIPWCRSSSCNSTRVTSPFWMFASRASRC